MNLRCDDSFVQDNSWYAAQELYTAFLKKLAGAKAILPRSICIDGDIGDVLDAMLL